jgi:hypothetical protein
MEDDMVARWLASRTRSSYLWALSSVARFYRRSPDQISDAEAQAYLVHLLRERHRSSRTCSVVVSGLRFVYHVTLKRDRMTFDMPLSRRPGTLPVLLSNDRLVDHRDDRVGFRWKDYADHDRVKVLTLTADEFLRRFLLHIVPRGFRRIRHFGLLANRTRRATLTRCRTLLGQSPLEDAQPESLAVLMQRVTGMDRARCPVCGEGRMQIVVLVMAVAPPDTS